MANVWSESEVEAIVLDYFNMLYKELSGSKYNKSQHRRELIAILNNRTEGAVERKHQNISAVLIAVGMPYIDGYKPLGNYQKPLFDAVKMWVSNNQSLHCLLEKDAVKIPVMPSEIDFSNVLVGAPSPNETSSNIIKEPSFVNDYIGVDYLEMEANNIRLGNAGEDFVIQYERERLTKVGKTSLADNVEQVSVTQGPSAGFDIRSFDESGKERFIEVKATKHGKSTPFFLTPNELRFSQRNCESYHLYRVFKFESDPKMFTVQGSLQDLCIIKPSQFLVSMR